MTYSRWATEEEIKEKLAKYDYNFNIESSGIIMIHDDKNIFTKKDESHSLIIGSNGSGKTQTTVLPNLRLAIKAQESFVVNATNKELYSILCGELKKENYNTIVIDLENNKLGNNYNPLTLPYKMYKNGKKDNAIDILEDIAYYICTTENKNSHQDPFWENSAISLFIGLALYLFENATEEKININSVANLAENLDKITDKIKSMDKLSQIYINLSPVVLSPNETKGSVLAVFKQSMRLFTSREELSKLMSATDFDIESIQKEKTAVFIISNNKPYSRRLVPLIFDQIYMASVNNDNKTRRLNVLVEEFDNIFPIKELNNKLTVSRNYNIRFNAYIRSYHELNHIYGKAETDILELSFENIIYLASKDMETLEKISKYCGKVNDVEPLISVDELKLLDNFETIILIPRLHPIRTKLLPDYKINWNFSDEKVDIKELKNKELEVYQI